MRRLVYLLLAGLLSACATQTIKAPVGDRSQRPAHNPDYHTVRHGDTLYSVAFLYGYQVEEVAEWNALVPPYTIYKGQRLRLKPPPEPVSVKEPETRLPKIRPSRPKPRPVAPSRPKAVSKPVAPSTPKVSPSKPRPKPKPTAPTNRRLTWKWPAGGRLLQGYTAGGGGKKGIDIAGRSGEQVLAAAAGKVVYSGSGLSGYGRLIIIKHNKDFLSAYAHNRKLIAREGQWVEQGQVIAQMGRSGTDRV